VLLPRGQRRARVGYPPDRAAGILAGASESILKFGTRKSTMGDIARIGGVAKATLYNHFRDKTELYAALVASEVDALIDRCASAYAASVDDPLPDAIAVAALAVAEHPVLRRLVETEPAVLGTLCRFGDSAAWARARGYAAGLAGLGQPSAAGDLGIRWVLSHAGWPASREQIVAEAPAVAAAMRAVATTRAAVDDGYPPGAPNEP
jgi:AcrR family transcriptional regulator